LYDFESELLFIRDFATVSTHAEALSSSNFQSYTIADHRAFASAIADAHTSENFISSICVIFILLF